MTKQVSSPTNELDELRRLLVQPEKEKIEQISERLESREQFAGQVSDVLPQAMLKSAEQGRQLSEALVPTVEEIVKLSINRDINRFADALFPVIGPAIRKSISESIRQMLQSLNQMLESSLSVQGLKWRWESIRTGVSFAEIVMLNSLVYRVEQVFLIHRQTGLLLSHAEFVNRQGKDADLVSSMLSAIGDFVGDSFNLDANQGLDTVQFGELSIWIKQGPETLLAVAIRGDAPEQLRAIMQETLEDIELHFAESIHRFDGDTDSFTATEPYLEVCLQAQYKPRQKKMSLKTRLVWVLVGLLVAYWLVSLWYENRITQDYVKLLKSEPGYVITDTFRDNGRLVMRGLRDPLARDPDQLVALSQLDAQDVVHELEPYQSLDRQFVHRRMLSIIQPPENVSLKVRNDSLVVTGLASEDWIREFHSRTRLIPGIHHIDSSALTSEVDLSPLDAPPTVRLDFDANRGFLKASGSASPDWQQQARVTAVTMDAVREYDDSDLQLFPRLTDLSIPDTIQLEFLGRKLLVSGEADSEWIQWFLQQLKRYPAISQVDLEQLKNLDEIELQYAIQQLEQTSIFFDQAESFTLSEEAAIEQATRNARRIQDFANRLGISPLIIVNGFTDSLGQFQDNRVLSKERADFVAQYLFNGGINPRFVEVRGISQPVPRESSAAERRFNRRVTFDVILSTEGESS